MHTQDELPVAITPLAMTVGAFTAVLMLVFSAVGWQFMVWFIFMFGVWYGMRFWRKEKVGSISYFLALNIGAKTAFYTSLIMAFANYVAATLEPSLIIKTLDAVEQRLLTLEVPSLLTETAMQQWREILTPLMLGGITIFMYTVFGFFVALFCAFFIKKGQPPVSDEPLNP